MSGWQLKLIIPLSYQTLMRPCLIMKKLYIHRFFPYSSLRFLIFLIGGAPWDSVPHLTHPGSAFSYWVLLISLPSWVFVPLWKCCLSLVFLSPHWFWPCFTLSSQYLVCSSSLETRSTDRTLILLISLFVKWTIDMKSSVKFWFSFRLNSFFFRLHTIFPTTNTYFALVPI